MVTMGTLGCIVLRDLDSRVQPHLHNIGWTGGCARLRVATLWLNVWAAMLVMG